MEERYSRNIPAISEQDMNKLRNAHVLVVGCGGLGGFIIEYLARLGIGTITVVDGDVFSESNLNRQLLSTSDTLGKLKAEVAADRVKSINPDVNAISICENITEDNASEIIGNATLIIDALDNVDSRFILEDAAEKADKVIVHGAIDGWNMQAMLIKPGSGLLHKLYINENNNNRTALAFTPAVCAGVQVAAAVNYICNAESSLDGKLLIASLKDMTSSVISIN